MSKNVHKYYNKCLDYCKLVGITVYEEKGGEIYITEKNIYINSSHKTLLQISSILHELGHFIDDIETKYKYDEIYIKAQKKMESKPEIKLNQQEFDAIMRCETKAWNYAIVIARQLSIPLGKWFHNDMKRSLADYRSAKCFKKVNKDLTYT